MEEERLEIDIEELLQLKNVAVVDVRSPKEYHEDHINNAINVPILDDEERAIIGTLYKQEGKSVAVDRGIDLTKDKLGDFYQIFQKLSDEYDQVVVYCFRGGMRSQSIVNFVNATGMQVRKLAGGYKSYRKHVMDFFEQHLDAYTFVTLHGHTGSGKTELLQKIASKGLNVLDLEFYAKHSGSVFGDIFFKEGQPSQKTFESLLFDHLTQREKGYVFMESESPKIGRVYIPPGFVKKMEEGRHILLECSMENRVARLVEDYTRVQRQDDSMIRSSISVLKRMLGGEPVNQMLEWVDQEAYDKVVRYLLENYYDKFYEFSIDKYNYEKVLPVNDMNEAVKWMLEEFSEQ